MTSPIRKAGEKYKNNGRVIKPGHFIGVPGMTDNLGGESPPSNLMEVKDREAQGRYCEVGSEGSVDQMHELTYRNQI